MRKSLDNPAAVGILYLVLMLVGVVCVRGTALFNGPLWLDEHHTALLASRGSLLQSMRDLAAGSDFDPPLLYVLQRLTGWFSGGVTPLSLRVTSFAAVLLALVFVFLALRRIFSPAAAFIGGFSLWANTLVVEFAFEARAYGPWLLFCAVALWAIGWKPETEVSRKRDVVLAVSSILICIIHYYGLIALALVATGSAMWLWRTGKHYRPLLPMIAGPVSLMACLPLFLGQRDALTVKTWIAPLALYQIREMLEAYFIAGPILVVLTVMILSAAWRVLGRGEKIVLPARVTSAIPFLALLLMPAVMVLISAFVQPSMQLRYVIPATLAWAPIFAFASDRLSGAGKFVVVSIVFLFSLSGLNWYARNRETFRSHTLAETAAVTPFLDSGFVLMDPSRTSLYPLQVATARPTQLVFADFSDSIARSRHFSAPMIIDRDVARVHNRLYGFPRLESIEDYRKKDLYFFVPVYGTLYTLSLLFPNAAVTRVAPRIYRISAHGDTAALTDQLQRAIHELSVDHAAAAVGVLDSILGRDPAHYAALWYRAAALESLGKKGDAVRAWRTAIAESDQNGWRDGAEQAHRRMWRLICSNLSPAERIRAELPRFTTIRRYFSCSNAS